MNIETIQAVICPFCKDMWELSASEYNLIYIYMCALLLCRTPGAHIPEYLIEETDCHCCKNMYTPVWNMIKMDKFVYDAVKRCKM
jgi:hypothetical protein